MKLQTADIEGIKNIIEQKKTFAITTHTNPDGDAVGSTLALAHILQQLGKDVQIIMPNDCPAFLKWLKGYDSIMLFDKQKKQAAEFLRKADVIFCLDYNNPSRLDAMGDLIISSKKPLILIDHHPEPICNATYMISETKACSTAELVYRCIYAMKYEHLITHDIANALYTGIITDTGGLIHNSSNPELYKIVAELMQKGIDKNFIHDQIFNVYSYERMKLMGLVLKDNFEFFPEYNAAYMFISIQNQKDHNFQLGDSEGLVNLPLAVKDIKFCALFTEYKNNMIKISFRSKRDFPANQFSADFFNGGGHRNAAGGRIDTSLDNAIALFKKGLSTYKTQLNKS
ncbi:MAG: bifunctional oligoribonuclease/PAP phosphatase NrnA [Bacteroidales bacterium]